MSCLSSSSELRQLDLGAPARHEHHLPVKLLLHALTPSAPTISDLRPEVGYMGEDQMITPNIDKLASESLVFNRAYCQQAICGPTRNSFLRCAAGAAGVMPPVCHAPCQHGAAIYRGCFPTLHGGPSCSAAVGDLSGQRCGTS